MADCECLPKCLFFNDKMGKRPAMAEMYKKKYCLGDASDCGRHIVFEALGREAVPPDLFPNQKDRATELLMATH